MSRRRFKKLTPLEKAQEDAYNVAYNLYDALLINAYMISGSLDEDIEFVNMPSGGTTLITSGSQTPSGHQAA